MTREEAVERLKSIKSLVDKYDDVMALREAIKALEQEPCEDAISRQAAIKEVYKMPNYAFATVDVLEVIEQLPSVTPKQKTGHWTWLRPAVVQCDDCQYIHTILDDSENGRGINYCPSCGRKMEGRP